MCISETAPSSLDPYTWSLHIGLFARSSCSTARARLVIRRKATSLPRRKTHTRHAPCTLLPSRCVPSLGNLPPPRCLKVRDYPDMVQQLVNFVLAHCTPCVELSWRMPRPLGGVHVCPVDVALSWGSFKAPSFASQKWRMKVPNFFTLIGCRSERLRGCRRHGTISSSFDDAYLPKNIPRCLGPSRTCHVVRSYRSSRSYRQDANRRLVRLALSSNLI